MPWSNYIVIIAWEEGLNYLYQHCNNWPLCPTWQKNNTRTHVEIPDNCSIGTNWPLCPTWQQNNTRSHVEIPDSCSTGTTYLDERRSELDERNGGKRPLWVHLERSLLKTVQVAHDDQQIRCSLHREEAASWNVDTFHQKKRDSFIHSFILNIYIAPIIN